MKNKLQNKVSVDSLKIETRLRIWQEITVSEYVNEVYF